MTKSDIVKGIAQKTGISKTDTQLVIDVYMESIRDAVKKGEKVYLRKFGTFQTKQRAKRVTHNIHTQKKVVLPMRKVPIFKPSSLFLQEV